MDNQKNGQCGDVINKEAVNSDFCPVRSTAACASAIMAQGMPLTTPISFVQSGIHELPPHILFAVRCGAKFVKLTDSGYSLSRIGAHSLRASGAMACGCPDMARRQSRGWDAGGLKRSSLISTPRFAELPRSTSKKFGKRSSSIM
jgi:hypothetical protein